MAATGAKIGNKTRFYQETPAGSGLYVLVAEVKQISGPTRSRGVADATHLETPDDYEEQIASVKNGGEVSLTLNFRPDDPTHGAVSGLEAAFEDGVTRKWRIEWPQFAGSPSLTFPGFLTGAPEPTISVKDVIAVTVKVKVTGKPVPANFA